ncbi:methyltransferase [Streptomyces antibioticus]|nr:class I SAM-dependent methyltransferase [Streptomyces antibioticus]KUN18772.1 methyltransferase [Streptomyces antibioticus]
MTGAHEVTPDVIELYDDEQTAVWQEFRLGGMPDLISAMNLCHALLALDDSGILASLRHGKHRPEEGLLDGTVEHLGTHLLDYLTMRGVLDRRGGGYFLSRKGELLTSDVSLARLGIYLDAYGPVLSRTNDLVAGRITYGADVQRRGGPLGRHCATLFSAFHTPVLVRAMRERGVQRLLDVGCGGGSSLVDACLRDPHLTGVGLDIDADAIDEARALAAREGVADRVTFVVADAFAPQTWPEPARSADGMSIVSALHELFRDGEQAVADMLTAYGRALPDLKILLVGEPEIRGDAQDNDDDFFLIHAMTDQGMPRDRASWLGVIARSELTCRRIYRRPDAGPRLCFYDLIPRQRPAHRPSQGNARG